MTEITIGGKPTHTIGSLPQVGTTAPSFTLVGQDLGEVVSHDFKGRKLLLNIFPSLDTDVCSMSVRKFNQMAQDLQDTSVLCISVDLPFALSRFCGVEGIDNALAASAFRSTFGQDYGVTIIDGPMRGLLSRCVVVIDSLGKVIYNQQVPEISTEPDYQAARQSVESLG